MGNIWALTRREVHAYFTSPVAYVVLAAWLLVFGYFFSAFLEFFLDPQQRPPGQVMNVNQDLIRGMFHATVFFLLILLPLVTMRSFSEELRSGTIELLFTSPLTDFELVLGKFLGALSLYGVMLATTLLHMGLLFYFGDPEWKPLVVGYLGMALLGAAFIAVGLMFSALTKNQIVAAFMTIGVFLLLYLLELRFGWGEYLSPDRRLQEFAKGVIDTRDVVFFLSFITLGLFLTKQVVQSYRWRT